MTEQLELEDVQGLVVRGHGTLGFATFLLFEVDDPAAARSVLGGWVSSVTTADMSRPATAVHVAFTALGIAALTESSVADAGFSEQFVSGMTTPYRSRLLGDVEGEDPAGWGWGGPGTAPVHLMLMLYAGDDAGLQAQVGQLRTEAERGGLRLRHRLDTDELSDREPFGFRDGISQPLLAGLPRACDAAGTVAAGEFVLGYLNEYGQRTERPLLPPERDPDHLLPRDPQGSGAADLGRNGSYLVFRQLRQDVEAFWDFVRARCEHDYSDGTVQPEHLAAKLVGRWPSGAPLVLARGHDDPSLGAANDFAYHDLDPLGLACPLGAHVRRTNPRDSLQPGPGTEKSREVNRRHRLLRRGRNYCAAKEEPAERGVHFLCLNANLARQFEFVQHSWVNDPSFNDLYDSADPLVGPTNRGGSTFNVPAEPVRTRLTDVPQFVSVRGGAYFFLPGLRALRHLAARPVRR